MLPRWAPAQQRIISCCAASGARYFYLTRFLHANRYPLRLKTLSLIILRLARDPLEQFLDLAVLLALAVGPFTDHLLLPAHMRHQPLNGFGKVGHRRGGAAAAAALLHGRAQPFDGGLQVAAGGLRGIAAHRGGEPVFKGG